MGQREAPIDCESSERRVPHGRDHVPTEKAALRFFGALKALAVGTMDGGVLNGCGRIWQGTTCGATLRHDY